MFSQDIQVSHLMQLLKEVYLLNLLKVTIEPLFKMPIEL